MKQIYTYSLFLVFVCVLHHADCQELKIGIRAGVNYAKFLGPSEEGAKETTSFNNGFHFGLNIGYQFNDFVSIQSGIMYIQNGSNYNYEGDGYYIFNIPSDPRYPIFDTTSVNLSISNAYISIPLTFNVKTLDRWEFVMGVYGSLLISPVGSGILNFGHMEDINYVFEQGLDYQYSSDRAGEFNPFLATEPIQLIVNNEDANLPQIVGAYYLYTEKNGNLYNRLDYGITGGISYFFNPGLYAGLRVDYGLKDLTNNRMDRSRQELNEDGSFVFRDDFDRNFGFQVSLGFRF